MKKLIFLTYLFLFSLTAGAQTVYEYHLENGLKVLIKPDHRFPTVVSEVWYKVGSSYEHDGITGISHALEHMMFRGTKDYPAGKFTEIINQHGGIQNAFTNFDFTAYFQVLPASNLEISFKLEADRMQHLILDKNLFTKEMKAIQEERRLRVDDKPDSVMLERFTAAAFVSSPYHHPIIGWKNDLDHMTIEDLKNWYDRWYAPNNAILVVVGDIDPVKTYELAKKYFEKIPAKTIPPLKPRKEIKPLGETTVNINIPAKLPSIIMGFPVPSLVTIQSNPEVAYTLMVISQILSGGESARLEKMLVRHRQIATAAQSFYDLYQRQNGLFILYGVPAQGYDTATIKKEFLKQIELLQKSPVSATELERVKSFLIAQEVYKKDSIQEQANEIGELEAVGLSYKAADEYIKNIQAVTPENIMHVAKLYLTPDRMTVGILNPLPLSSASIPNTQPNPSNAQTYEKQLPHH